MGAPRGDRQQPVAVAGDQDRHVGHVLTHVLGDVLAGARRAAVRVGKRHLGGLELLLHVAGAQAQFEAAAAEIAQRGDVAGQQCRLVEAGVEDERPEPSECLGAAAAIVNVGNGAGAPRWSGTCSTS